MTIELLEKKLEGGVKLTPPLPCDRWENSPPGEGLTHFSNDVEFVHMYGWVSHWLPV